MSLTPVEEATIEHSGMNPAGFRHARMLRYSFRGSRRPDLLHETLAPHAELSARELTLRLALNGHEIRTWFTCRQGIGSASDSLAALTLLPAMRAGSPLELPEPVSPQLLSAMPRIQDIYHAWDRDRFERVPVRAGTRREQKTPAPGVGCLFSGGLDSFYTLLKHRQEVTHLIFADGYDIPLRDTARRERAVSVARKVADELGKTLIEVHTDLPLFTRDVGVMWQTYHGAALAAAALLFQDRLGRVLIPASFSYADLFPWGSHPILDPLWSTEQTTIEHSGCEATRVEKVGYVSAYPVAMRNLRVCSEHRADYNCGHCEKCFRTMLNLRAAGASDRCETLPGELDPETIANLSLEGENARAFALENLRALERLGNEPELARALETALESNFEGEHVRRQLDGTRTELVETRRRLHEAGTKHRQNAERLRSRAEVLETRNERLKERATELEMSNESLAEANMHLKGHYSSRRYRLADLLADGALKVPGIKRLLRKTADGPSR
ncbi:MAG TPA: hypothetical protein VF068_06430 [Rubrobacter sp.]